MTRRWALTGFMGGALSLSFLWAANQLDVRVAFPPLAVAERVIRVVPGPVETFFIESLGRNALRILEAGAILVALALSALFPSVTRVRRPELLGALAGLAVVGADYADPVRPELVPTLLSAVVSGAVFGVSVAWLDDAVGRAASAETDATRRRALAAVAGAAVAVALGGTALGRIVRRFRGPDTDVPIRAADVRASVPKRRGFPRVAGLSPEITSAADHYVVDIDLVDPILEASGWTLAVEGLVRRPIRLSFDELQRRFPLVEEYAVLTCISNRVGGSLVGNSKWTGVRLADVLEEVGVRAPVIDVVFRCADGYASSLPLPAALDPSVLLVIAQNGRPLEWDHGFPCRLRAPAYYGVKNAKWLEEIELVPFDFKDYWTVRGWSDVALVRTESRIDTTDIHPAAGQPTWIAGVAWAGDRRIAQMEISVDGGATWRPALLHEPLSSLAWTQWAYRWTPTRPGAYRVLCRATDGTGRVQDRRERSPHPSGASGYHEVDVVVA